MVTHRICLLGGTGFVGRSIAARLVAAGHHVHIITRRRERHRDLLVLPTLQLVEGDVFNPAVLRNEFQDKDVVINLVGILNERGRDGSGFDKVHAELPANVVHACRQAGITRLLHMSALNASVNGPSHYLRTKGRGEHIVHEAGNNHFHVTSFRPSVIFGRNDSFTNRFAGLLRRTPLAFPLACPEARFQPVFVEDVARAFVDALDRHQTFGQRYNLCGPKVYTLREIVAYLVSLLGVKRRIIGLGPGLSHLQAMLLEFAPGKPFSLDNFRSLQLDSVCHAPFPAIFGIDPARLEQIVPAYIGAPQRSPA